jgi:predicted dehydrogenase
MVYDAAVIGTGADPDNPNYDGFAMAYYHGEAYQDIEDTRLVACADIVRENAEAFADNFDLGAENVFEDYEELLAAVEPDVVSVCVPPAVHADIVVGCARSGVVDAIHCEKPMATTWGDSRRMVEVCDEEDVQLTFNHQRRFANEWVRARELLDDGEIGDLERVETAAPNIYDWGTHCLDLCGYYNDESPAEWVIGQIDYREENVWFGAHNENHAFASWEYENGVHGVASMGHGQDLVGAIHRLVGTDGVVEVRVEDGPDLRIKRDGDGDWEEVEVEDEEWTDPVWDAIADVVDALGSESASELDAHRALKGTEIIFATYESSRKRGRVDLPLEIEDNPLEAMVESGDLTPEPADE